VTRELALESRVVGKCGERNKWRQKKTLMLKAKISNRNASIGKFILKYSSARADRVRWGIYASSISSEATPALTRSPGVGISLIGIVNSCRDDVSTASLRCIVFTVGADSDSGRAIV